MTDEPQRGHQEGGGPDEAVQETPQDADQGKEADAATGQAEPALKAMEGGVNEAPEGFEEQVSEENREYANVYRQNLMAQAAETIKGLTLLHHMARAGNKEGRETMRVYWSLLADAGVAFPRNRAGRRKLKSVKGGLPPKEGEDAAG